MDFTWAENFPELHKICTLFRLEELCNPVKFSYTPLPCYLQQGPQCGLVALSMCTGAPNKEMVEELYNLAKQNDYTYNGEIFSVGYMKDLAEKYLKNVSNVTMYEGNLNSDHIKQFLLTGGILLVPFDSDVTNNPGLYNGHKAHWAVISGAIETEDDFFVIARHGKARNVAIWKLEDLAASNAQLNEFSPDRKLSDLEYKLPDGGINGPNGLNLKSVLINLSTR